MTAVRALIVIGISASFLLIAGPPMFQRAPWPYTGMTLASDSLSATTPVRVARGSPAYRAGMRSGDLVGCLRLADEQIVFPSYPPYTLYTGHPIALCYRHDGVWHDASLLPQRMSPPPYYYGNPAVAALRLLVYATFLVVGCLLVISRPGLMTWLLFGYCAASMPNALSQSMLVALPTSLYDAITIVTGTWVSVGAEILALFALLVPSDRPPPGWRRTLFLFLAAVAVAAAAYSTFTYVGTDFVLGRITNGLDESFTALTVFIVVARLATMTTQERARFAWAAFAIIFGVIANDVRNVVPNVAVSVAGGLLTVVMPLCLMYAILRRHVIDVRFVLSRTLLYGIITTVVVAIIGVVDWATSVYLHEARAAMAIEAGVIIALGFALHRAYGWIEYGVDFLLFRQKHEAGAYLGRLARTLPFAEREDTIDRALVYDPYERLELTAAALFRVNGPSYVASRAEGWEASALPAFDGEDDVVRFLLAERTRLLIDDLSPRVAGPFHRLGITPAIAIPIFHRNRLTAFVLYGLHRDGTRLDPDEVGVLEQVCSAAAQAYTAVELARYESLMPTTLPAMETL